MDNSKDKEWSAILQMMTNKCLGHKMTPCEAVDVPCVVPGGEADISVDMVSPSEPGIYQSRWQLNSPQRVPIGGE